MNRLYLAVGALLVILALAWLALSQHDGKVREGIRADIAMETVSRAVEASKEATKADVRVQRKKRAVLDSVAPRATLLREVNAYAPETPVDPARPDPWVGMFNDAVRASNSAIESAGSLP